MARERSRFPKPFGLARFALAGGVMLLLAAFVTAEAADPRGKRFGGTVNVALYSEPPTLDTMWTTAIVVAIPAQHVFEYLFAYDEQWLPRPHLVKDYQVTDGGLTYTLKLRQGVPFHDGGKMTAKDVVASLRRWSLVSGFGRATFKRVKELEAVDDSTVRVRLTTQFAPLLAYLSGPLGGGAIIMPAHVANAAGDKRLTEAQYIGTGPYRFVEYRPDRHYLLRRFDAYASRDERPRSYVGARTAYFDQVRFITVPSAPARIAGVEVGDYDWAEEVTRDEFERLTAHPNVKTIVLKPLRWKGLVLNKQQGPMTDVRLRRAVLLALDNEEVMRAAFGRKEFWRLDGSLAPPESAFHSRVGTEQYNTRNLELARRLVAESGYAGQPVRWMSPSDREDYFAVAVTAVPMLRKIGLNAEVKGVDWGSLVKLRTQPGDYEIFNTGFSFSPEPTTLGFIPATWPGWWKDSPQKQAALAAVMEETDPGRRLKRWAEFQKVFYDEVPVVKVGDFFGLTIHRASLRGDNTPVSAWPVFWNTWRE